MKARGSTKSNFPPLVSFTHTHTHTQSFESFTPRGMGGSGGKGGGKSRSTGEPCSLAWESISQGRRNKERKFHSKSNPR